MMVIISGDLARTMLEFFFSIRASVISTVSKFELWLGILPKREKKKVVKQSLERLQELL